MKRCGKCYFIDPKDKPPICGEGYNIKEIDGVIVSVNCKLPVNVCKVKK